MRIATKNFYVFNKIIFSFHLFYKLHQSILLAHINIESLKSFVSIFAVLDIFSTYKFPTEFVFNDIANFDKISIYSKKLLLLSKNKYVYFHQYLFYGQSFVDRICVKT